MIARYNAVRFALLAMVSLMLLLCGARGAVISGTFVPVGSGTNIDLTSAGALDWIHWGLDSTNSNRKAGVSPTIGEVTLIGESVPQQITNSIQFSWFDGVPAATATNVATSLAVSSVTNGFSVQIPASVSVQKLRVYVGVYAAQGQLEVLLNDETILPYVDSSLDSIGGTNGFYLIDFQANTNGDVLTIRFTATTLHETNGYVTLEAVALSTNAAPSVTMTSPTNEMNVVLGSETLLTASAFDTDGTVTNVEFFVDGTNKVGQATSAPYQVLWTSTSVGPKALTAVATDSNGGHAISASITVFVTTTNGALLATVATAAATVDLTAEGTSDWVHWGLFNENSVDRKAAVASQISNYTIVGQQPAYNYGDSFTGCTWSDGTPNASVSGTPTGIYVVGLNNGFQLTVPADPNPRTLKVYLGTYGAKGKLTATFSDYSAPVIIDRSIDNPGNGPASVYTLNYAAASMGQTVIVTFTCDQMHDGFGNVTLQAATLVSAVNPLNLSIGSPSENAIFAAPATVVLQASLSGGDGSPQTIEFYNGASKVGQATTAPYVFNWNNVVAGNYTVTARTTNSLGGVLASNPVHLFLVGSGGFVAGRFDPSGGAVNLTAEGTKDWAHWGLLRKNSFDRNRNSVPQISNFTVIGEGTVNQYSDNIVSFNWTNGTPTLSMPGTTTGVYIDTLGSGFQITVPAGRTLRRLKIYTGLFAAQGELHATLSDFSAPPFINTSFQNVFNNATGVYTVEYAAASAGQTLTLTYTSKTLFDGTYGNVTLQAATVASISSVVSSPTATATGLNFTFSTELNWNYFVDATGSLSPPEWIPVTNYVGTGSNIIFADTTLSGFNRFYRVRMSK